MGTEENITYAEILRVLQSIKAVSHFSEIHLKFGDIEIDLFRGAQSTLASNSAAPSVAATASAPLDRPESKPAAVERPPEAHYSAHSKSDHTWPPNSVLVRSPMVGTFYRKPSPDAAPFVEIGQSVEQDSILCLVEVMKLLNSVHAGARGTITHILVSDAELIEHNQTLMVIDPR